MPKVSIIIPIYNVQDYLAKCIESCINQSLKDIEIILVDDKSTDNSFSIAMQYKKIDSRIVLIQNPKNLGTFLARAEGIKRVSGEYIIFLDADDYLMLDTAESAYNLALSNNADMVHFGLIHEPYNKYATLPRIYVEPLLNEEIANEIIIKHFKQSWFIICTRLFKSELVKVAMQKLSFIDRHLISSEDSVLFLTLCLLAKKSVGIDRNFYIYCENANSIMRSIDEQKLCKQIEDRSYLNSCLYRLSNDSTLSSHKYFKKCIANISNMLNYFICYSKRFLSNDGGFISPYIKYSLLSFRYMPRWQILLKMFIFIASIGKKRL